MRNGMITLIALLAGWLFASTGIAQSVVVYRQVLPAVSPAPITTVYSPIVAPPAVTTYSPVIPTAPIVPATTVYSPVVRAGSPVVVYSPVIPATPPIVTYRPLTTTYAAPAVLPAAVTVGSPVIVRPKVYVPGQPVRNFFRAITP